MGADWLLVAGCWLLVAGCWLPVAGCQLSVVSCQLPVAGCRLPVAGRQLSVVSGWHAVWPPTTYSTLSTQHSALSTQHSALTASNQQPATSNQQPVRFRLAIFDLAGEPRLSGELIRSLAAGGRFAVLDRSLVSAALAGAGYGGSLNLTREEARRLGTVTGADYLVLGLASVIESLPSNDSPRVEARLGLFLVDGRTGALVRFREVEASALDRTQTVTQLFKELGPEVERWPDLCEASTSARETSPLPPAGIIDLTGPVAPPDVRPPRFFKRPAPVFTAQAERAGVSATVEIIVQFNADGTYGPIEVVRWAGFGLDEATVEAVRACRFWPAERAGNPAGCRALLRYHFRVRS